uniref:(northern house mosquito) hypothetical protein n=1 Tax=Culex pipiens TaxID=7175 RepID=A0A8D8G0J1_CULPI
MIAARICASRCQSLDGSERRSTRLPGRHRFVTGSRSHSNGVSSWENNSFWWALAISSNPKPGSVESSVAGLDGTGVLLPEKRISMSGLLDDPSQLHLLMMESVTHIFFIRCRVTFDPSPVSTI